MTAAAATAEPASHPDPHQDSAAATRTARVLGLLHKLIDFAKELAAAAQQRPTGEALIRLAMRFGTESTALILAGIARGLRLAAMLEEKLGGGPARQNPAFAAAAALSPRRPRAPRPESPANSKLRLSAPTPKEIAAWVRRYPIETVLFHIRSELGLTPDDPLWQETEDLLSEYRADLMRQARAIEREQAAAANPSQASEPPGTGHSAARALDSQTKNPYRAYLMRSASCFPPDTPLMASPVPRQPATHLVSAATSGAGPP